MSSSLFRKEALAHQKENFFGDVLLTQPLSTTLLSYLAAIIGIIILLFLFLGSYTPKQTVSGYLVPDKGLSKLVAPMLSTISVVKVEEGQSVTSGDVLLTASVAHVQEKGDDLEEVLRQELLLSETELKRKRENERNLFGLEQSRLENQLESLKEEVIQLQQQKGRQEERVLFTQKRVDGAKQLLETGNLSDAGYQEYYEAHLNAQQQLDELSRQLSLKQAAIVAAEKDLEELPLQHASRLSDLETAVSDIHQRLVDLKGRQEYAIKAPFDGEVTAVQVYPGQSINAGALLLAVVPEGAALRADLFVPTRAIGFVESELPVRIRYAAFPHEKFGIYTGRVTNISKTILLPTELPIPVTLNEPVYRVQIELDDQVVQAFRKEFPLQAGMLLEADIMLEKRSLIEWILSPLYNFRGRL